MLLRITTLCLLAVSQMAQTASGAGVLDGLYKVPATSSSSAGVTRADFDSSDETTYRHLRFDSVAALDADQKTVLARLAAEDFAGMALARSVFENGAFSESYASLTIDDPEFIARTVPANTRVSGITDAGVAIEGVAVLGSPQGNKTLVVHYKNNNEAVATAAGVVAGTLEGVGGNHLCRVGGNPRPITTGCFSPTGTVTLILPDPNPTAGLVDGDRGGGVAVYYDYTYNPLLHNSNALSLATLRGERTEPYQKTLRKYVDFYGSPDYDNEWIRAAFEGRKTPGFSTSGLPAGVSTDADFDFSKMDLEGRHASLKWGMVVLKVWAFVVESLEEAVSSCDGTMSNSATSVDLWDRAVAAYTGSGPIASLPSNPDEGYFLYNLVETDCRDFGTCPTTTTANNNNAPMAPLNTKVYADFRVGRDALVGGDCLSAEEHAESISSKLTIPLVQGILRNTHALDLQELHHGWILGQATAYAAAILPLLRECSSGNAYVLLEDLVRRDATKASFEVVKDTLERSYTCLGITCEDVGGLLTVNRNGYEPGAGPCGTTAGGGSGSSTIDPAAPPPPGSSTTTTTTTTPTKTGAILRQASEERLVVGISIGAVLAAALAAVAYFCIDARRAKHYEVGTEGVDREIARMAAAGGGGSNDDDEGIDENAITDMTSDAQIV